MDAGRAKDAGIDVAKLEDPIQEKDTVEKDVVDAGNANDAGIDVAKLEDPIQEKTVDGKAYV